MSELEKTLIKCLRESSTFDRECLWEILEKGNLEIKDSITSDEKITHDYIPGAKKENGNIDIMSDKPCRMCRWWESGMCRYNKIMAGDYCNDKNSYKYFIGQVNAK